MTKQEILGAIKDFSEEFPKEAIRKIQADRESFIPDLLDSLDYAYHNAKKLHDDNSDYFMHIYAMYLLAEFKEKRAFLLLIQMLRLSEDEIDFILGDCLTDSFARMLLSTYDGENMQMLIDIIENQALYEWARLAAVNTYKLLTKEEIVAKGESVSYLRSLIYDKLPSDDSYVVFTGIVGCVIHARLIDMIPDVRFLYDDDRVDTMVHGKYDDFIDWMFFKERPQPSYIDDAVSEMEWWACFKNGHEDSSKRGKDSLDNLFDEIKKGVEQEKLVKQKPKKVGRNDPCPCGSGKKYKKCCIDAPQNNTSVPRLEDSYDLLEMYPKNSALFEQMYEEEAVGIDKLAYMALHHRSIPIWVKRDMNQERIDKIDYLNEALALFLDKCQREQIDSFHAYDEKFMVHYQSNEWVSALIDLVEENDSAALISLRQTAEDVMQRFS